MVSSRFLDAEILHTSAKFPKESENDHTLLIKCTMSTVITVIIQYSDLEMKYLKGGDNGVQNDP